jgi:hypothetical protein
MPGADPTEPVLEVQVTFAVPERVLNWAIAQASRQTTGDLDHVTAILVAAHRDAKVVAVKLPKGWSG